MSNDLFDIHCHGAIGEQFGTSAEGTRAAMAHHRARGTEHVVASLVSGSDVTLSNQVQTLAPLVADGTLAGVHLEGPYLSHERRGAHDAAVLRAPDTGFVDRLVDSVGPGVIRQMTFAPELPGADGLIAALARHGVRPAVGHTDASADVVARAAARISDATGAPALVTHLFNGMPPFHHRSGGPVAAALTAASRGEAYVELIADGVHISADVARMVFETIGPEYIVLVSDAMSATGLGDGRYQLGTLEVEVTDGTARLVQEGGLGSIAGSTSTLADIVRWATDVAGIDAADVLHSTTVTPRAALGLQ